jgi:hypothetical protein
MKKAYKKPRIVKVSLKVDQTVLGGCKYENYTGVGPMVVGCGYPALCVIDGS